MSRNSVLDGLRSNLFEFIQESMLEKVSESISSEEVEFEGVKEMYNTSTNQLFLFHHTNIKIKAQTYTVTNIITATPVKVKQKSNIYILW